MTRQDVKCATANEYEGPYYIWVFGGVGQRQHRAPGVTHEGTPHTRTSFLHQLMEVIDVPCNRQWLTTAAPLHGLEDPESIRKSPGQGLHVPRSPWAAVQDEHEGTRGAVCA